MKNTFYGADVSEISNSSILCKYIYYAELKETHQTFEKDSVNKNVNTFVSSDLCFRASVYVCLQPCHWRSNIYVFNT